MYLLNPTDPAILEAYYAKYSPQIRSKFTTLLADGSLNIEKRGIKFKCLLENGIIEFLEKYSREEYLRKLVIGNWEELKEILLEIKALDPLFNVGISKSKHKLRDKKDEYEVNDINAIFHKLLVEDLYESFDIFDKSELIRWKNLSICPYCGAKSIVMYAGTGNRTVKPQIDHFLPKSKYPYFAVSFNNLFPVCGDCNGLYNKGENDPLASDFMTERLMHPSNFDSTALIFVGKESMEGDMNPENFGLSVEYKNSFIKEGYNDVVAIEAYYQTQKPLIRNIYSLMWKSDEARKNYLEKRGVDESFFLSPFHILRFEESEENSRIIEKYKFQLDLYNSFLNKITSP